MSKLVYVTRKIPDIGIQMMKDKGYTVDIGEKFDKPTKEEIIAAISQKPYDCIVSFLTDPIDKDIFNACKTIKLVAQYAVGFNNIDLQEAKNRSILVTNTPGSSSRAVAEQTVALILALTTRTGEGDRYMRSGSYHGWSPYLLQGTDLTGKTVGLFGGGAIGQEVAAILHFGFNCPIIYTDVVKNQAIEEKYGATFVDKATLLKTSDIVSLHVPLLPSTKHLIDTQALELMKKEAFLVNTARGPVIDEAALVLALKNGVIKGAGLDVYEFEPELSEGLVSLENVVLTPHIASARESVRNMMAQAVGENVVSFFETGKVVTEVLI
jgi:glyoxylate reductase